VVPDTHRAMPEESGTLTASPNRAGLTRELRRVSQMVRPALSGLAHRFTRARVSRRQPLGLRDEPEMLDRWERVVEVMEKATPLLIPGRLPEPHRVVLKSLPLDEKKVAAGMLYAPV